MAGNSNSGRKAKINGARTSILIDAQVLAYLNRFDNVSAEIERLARKEMETTVKDNTILALDNPWTGATAKEMTWAEIEAWCEENVHPNDRKQWLIAARKAAEAGDSAELGKMIIGS